MLLSTRPSDAVARCRRLRWSTALKAQTRQKTATGVDKVLAAQEARDVRARLTQLNSIDSVDTKSLEVAFVRVAKKFGGNRGIGYGAWRDAGVSAQVLKRAGIARTRG